MCVRSSHRVTFDAPASLADPVSLINAIHEKKMMAGVAISPDTFSEAISDEVGAAADMLLVMTVYPGNKILCAPFTHAL